MLERTQHSTPPAETHRVVSQCTECLRINVTPPGGRICVRCMSDAEFDALLNVYTDDEYRRAA